MQYNVSAYFIRYIFYAVKELCFVDKTERDNYKHSSETLMKSELLCVKNGKRIRIQYLQEFCFLIISSRSSSSS